MHECDSDQDLKIRLFKSFFKRSCCTNIQWRGLLTDAESWLKILSRLDPQISDQCFQGRKAPLAPLYPSVQLLSHCLRPSLPPPFPFTGLPVHSFATADAARSSWKLERGETRMTHVRSESSAAPSFR